jgi:hypothetical protein
MEVLNNCATWQKQNARKVADSQSRYSITDKGSKKDRMIKNNMTALLDTLGTPVVGAAAAVLFSAVCYLIRSKSSSSQGGGRKRSLSFSSEVLLQGAFPEPVNVCQPIINGLFTFRECPSLAELVPKVKELALFDRFRSGAKEISPGKWILTELGPDFDVEKDIIETIEFDNENEMKEIVDRLSMKTISQNEKTPLWRLYRLIPRNKDSINTKGGILVRLHHVIGDGISMIGAMTKFFENENGGHFTLDIPEKMSGGNKFKFKLGFIVKFIRSLFKVLLLPQSFYDSNVTMIPDHHSKKKMPERCVNVDFPVIKLDFIKEIKNKANVTVNDVLLAATSGMIKRFSVLNNDPNIVGITPKQNAKLRTRALVPVAFPRPKKDLSSPSTALRNLWSFISVPLVIRENSAKDRLLSCAKNTRRLKRSPQAIIQLFVQNYLLSFLPLWFNRQTAFDAFSRHSMVFSNLPGPATMIKLCGKEVLGFQISFPNLLPQIIIMSYNNGIFFNLAIDEEILKNSATLPNVTDKKEILRQLFLEELKELAKEYGISTDEDYMIKKI